MADRKKSRILHLIGQLGQGGAENQLCCLLESLAGRYEFFVISYRPQSLDHLDRLLRAGVQVRIIDKEAGIAGRIRFLFKLANLMRQISPDIIQTWLPSANFWGCLGKILSGAAAATIASVRNFPQKPDLVGRLSEQAARWTSDTVIANSLAAKAAIVSRGLGEEKVRVIHNGISSACEVRAKKDEIRRELLIPANRFVVGTVGGLRPPKNHQMFLRAAQRLKHHIPRLHFVIVGDGELRGQMEQTIKASDLGAVVTLTGKRGDIPRVLKALDLFAMTSLSEGLPNAVMEAMSAGLPIIATNVGGIPELLTDGVDGLLIENDDLEGLVSAIEFAVLNPEFCHRLGRRARQSVTGRFSIETMSELTSRVYEELLSGSRVRRPGVDLRSICLTQSREGAKPRKVNP
ncbi:MAG: glycosyltransferase [Syntrophobacteraceae bacterium]